MSYCRLSHSKCAKCRHKYIFQMLWRSMVFRGIKLVNEHRVHCKSIYGGRIVVDTMRLYCHHLTSQLIQQSTWKIIYINARAVSRVLCIARTYPLTTEICLNFARGMCARVCVHYVFVSIFVFDLEICWCNINRRAHHWRKQSNWDQLVVAAWYRFVHSRRSTAVTPQINGSTNRMCVCVADWLWIWCMWPKTILSQRIFLLCI